jgi:hypothetical protein|tara:strand:- start:533 stop:928 length:396 start_codon:yes stop_codon:yes gene_type:complete
VRREIMNLTHNTSCDLHGAFVEMMMKYGKPKNNENWPDLCLTHDPEDPIQGEFIDESDEIIINMDQCATIRDAIETMVHEYQHYLQGGSSGACNWHDRYFEMGYSYEEHPYEIQAEDIVKRDAEEFMPCAD